MENMNVASMIDDDYLCDQYGETIDLFAIAQYMNDNATTVSQSPPAIRDEPMVSYPVVDISIASQYDQCHSPPPPPPTKQPSTKPVSTKAMQQSTKTVQPSQKSAPPKQPRLLMDLHLQGNLTAITPINLPSIPPIRVVRTHTPLEVQVSEKIEELLDKTMYNIIETHVTRNNENKRKLGDYILSNFPGTANGTDDYTIISNCQKSVIDNVEESTNRLRQNCKDILDAVMTLITKDISIMTSKSAEQCDALFCETGKKLEQFHGVAKKRIE